MMQHIEFECTKAAGAGPIGKQIVCRNCKKKVDERRIQEHNRTECKQVKCRVCGIMIYQGMLQDHNMAH